MNDKERQKQARFIRACWIWCGGIFLVTLALLFVMSAHASQGLISDFNTVRSSPLAESSLLDQSAQAASNNSCAKGGFLLPSNPGTSSFVTWQVYGYTTADQVWAAEQTDPTIMAYIKSTAYNAAGVGMTTPCGQLGVLWTIELGHLSSIVTPTGTGTPRVTYFHPTATPISTTPATATIRVTPAPISTSLPTCPVLSGHVIGIADIRAVVALFGGACR